MGPLVGSYALDATMQVQEFFDPATFTLTYVVFDEASRDAVVIDPVLDFDPLAAETGTASVEKVISFAKADLPPDMRCVFEHLQAASRERHLPTFERCAARP